MTYLLPAFLTCLCLSSCSVFRKSSPAPSAPVSRPAPTSASSPKPTLEKPSESKEKPKKETAPKPKTKNDEMADSIVEYAKKQLGTRYRHAGSTASGFDCSGLVVFVYSHFGIFVPRSSSSQYMASKRIDAGDIRPGDLVFFNGSHIGSNVGHVAIITEVYGKGRFKMIHSTLQKGVTIDTFPEGSYYPPRLVGYGRVIPE